MFAAHKAGGYGGGGHGRAGSFRWDIHGELVQGNLPISPRVNRSQPRKHLQGSRPGKGMQQEQRALGGDVLGVLKELRETGGNSESANPPCAPLPPALEAKGQAAKGRERKVLPALRTHKPRGLAL